MKIRTFIDTMQERKNQLKSDIKTKGILAIIERIDPRLYELLTYKEKREANLSPGEYSKRGKLAGYAHEKLTTLKETVFEYANRKEQEIKENIEGQVKEVLKHIDNIPQDLIDHIEEALAYKTFAAEDDMLEKKGFNVGDRVQKLVLDLGKLEARMSWYVENLNKLGLSLDEDEFIRDLLIITKANDTLEKNDLSDQKDRKNYNLEMWFQNKITTILDANKQQESLDTIAS